MIELKMKQIVLNILDFFKPASFGKLKLVIPPAIEAIFSKDKIEPYRI